MPLDGKLQEGECLLMYSGLLLMKHRATPSCPVWNPCIWLKHHRKGWSCSWTVSLATDFMYYSIWVGLDNISKVIWNLLLDAFWITVCEVFVEKTMLQWIREKSSNDEKPQHLRYYSNFLYRKQTTLAYCICCSTLWASCLVIYNKIVPSPKHH